MRDKKPDITLVVRTENYKLVKECYSSRYTSFETCDEVIEAFAGMLIDAGWMPESVYRAMGNIADEMNNYYNRKDDRIDELIDQVKELTNENTKLKETKQKSCGLHQGHGYGHGHGQNGNKGYEGCCNTMADTITIHSSYGGM